MAFSVKKKSKMCNCKQGQNTTVDELNGNRVDDFKFSPNVGEFSEACMIQEQQVD